MRIAVVCKDHIAGLVQVDVQREVGAGGRKPYQAVNTQEGKDEAWSSIEGMVKAHTKGTPGTPDRSYEVDDLIKGDKVKEDGNFIYGIRGHGKKKRKFLVRAWKEY